MASGKFELTFVGAATRKFPRYRRNHRTLDSAVREAHRVHGVIAYEPGKYSMQAAHPAIIYGPGLPADGKVVNANPRGSGGGGRGRQVERNPGNYNLRPATGEGGFDLLVDAALVDMIARDGADEETENEYEWYALVYGPIEIPADLVDAYGLTGDEVEFLKSVAGAIVCESVADDGTGYVEFSVEYFEDGGDLEERWEEVLDEVEEGEGEEEEDRGGEEYEEYPALENPAPTITPPGGGKPRTVKNLGWIIRNAGKIESLVWRKYSGPSTSGLQPEGDFIAIMRDGSVYKTEYASFSVFMSFVDRPVFRDLPITIYGERMRVGDSHFKELKHKKWF